MDQVMESRFERNHTNLLESPDELRWQAVRERNELHGETFFYAVITTGIYCRPACPSRRPRRENVRFFDSGEEAAQQGFRPCKRCQPGAASVSQQQRQTIIQICRYLETVDTLPNLQALAQRAQLSPYHFHRLFKSITGLTPRAYGLAARRARVRKTLDDDSSITEALYRAGFNSNSRFYAATSHDLGMTPSAFRDGGRGVRIRFAVGECTLGSILVAATERGVCTISLGENPAELLRALEDRFVNAELIGGDPAFETLVGAVIAKLEQPSSALSLPLDVAGTAFQQRVWMALAKIPVGETASYSAIAKAIGSPRAARAVARACAANPVAVAIPCHRVVRESGQLGGYRWGVRRKQSLLKREAGEVD